MRKEDIDRIDSRGMLKTALSLPDQISDALKLKVELETFSPRNIIIGGMGGSAIGGDILKSWLEDKLSIPVDVVRSYHLPRYADDSTLLMVVSYSGNTFETLSLLEAGVMRDCRILGVTSGGRMKEVLEDRGVPTVIVPSGYAPRSALAYLFIPLYLALDSLNLLDRKDEIKETSRRLKGIVRSFRPQIGEDNIPKTLSLKLVGRTPAIYAPHHLRVCAYRWMTQLNENAKVLAHFGVIPEMAHNEIVGWSENVRTEDFIPVLLRGSEHPNETEIIEFLKAILSEKEIEHEEIASETKPPLFEILYHIMIADLTSIYLAVIKGIDPWPVEPIDRLKSALRVRDDC